MKIYNEPQILKFKKDLYLYRYGYKIEGKSVFYLKSGKVQIKYNLGKGKDFIFILNEGSLFGLFETLSGLERRITEAKFLEDSILFLWTKDEFITELTINQDLGIKTISFLSNILREINRKIQELS